MRHLRQRGLEPLAVAVRADPQFQPAVRREARQRRLVAGHHRDAPRRVDAGAVAGLLGVHGKADADAPAVGLARLLPRAHLGEADGLDRPAQRLGVVAGIEVALGDVVERHLLGPHQALEADVVGLAAELACECVERHLQREAHARAGDAAVGQDRRLVGGHRIGAAAVVREIVEARQDRGDLPRLQAGGERIGRVGAGIDGGLAVERQQAAVRVGIGGEDVVVLAAVGVGGQALAPVLDPPAAARRPCAWPRRARSPPAAGCPCSRSRRRHRAPPRGSGPRPSPGIRQVPSARCAAAGSRCARPAGPAASAIAPPRRGPRAGS